MEFKEKTEIHYMKGREALQGSTRLLEEDINIS